MGGARTLLVGSPDAVPHRPEAFALPFRGRAESHQLLGLGRWTQARRLCPAGFAPVAFGDGTRALVQVSLMRWKSSPVGAYCASFVGLVVRRAGELAASSSPARPSGPAVLSAFLRAPKMLFVPAYGVGDVPGGPVGGAAASRAFGRAQLRMEKTHAQFSLHQGAGVHHLHVLEHRGAALGPYAVSGYSFSFSRRADRLSDRLPVSPSLLGCGALLPEALRALLAGGVKGAFIVPNVAGGGRLAFIGTRFSSRPRLIDLTRDRRAAFAPLVLDRPAPADGLGAVLEALEFQPQVLMLDDDLDGTITGNVGQPEEALA
jgi:hypothetical protein